MDKYTSQLADPAYKQEFTELMRQLINDYYHVNNLPYQLQIIGPHVRAAQPLVPDGSSVPRVLYHLPGDVEGTKLFKDFQQWVASLANASGDQEKKLGAIVQGKSTVSTLRDWQVTLVSGYGKTHLARTYTSTHRAVYILFTNELASTGDAMSRHGNKRKVLEFLDEKFATFKAAETVLKNVG